MKHDSSIKILNIEDALKVRTRLSDNELKVGLCHGTFDFIHLGHIRHFREASSKVDILFCSITPDRFVIKGEGRPFYKERERLEFLSELSLINYCFINDSATAIDLLGKLKPDVYIKGCDYINFEDDPTGNINKEYEAVKNFGGEMYFTQSEKMSSTYILNKYFQVKSI